jgi:hypothetical protein
MLEKPPEPPVNVAEIDVPAQTDGLSGNGTMVWETRSGKISNLFIPV